MSLTHFAAPCQQLFFVFVNFFHRSGEVVFVSAVREATQSSTACQQLFPLFDFFFHSTRCRRREVGNYSFPPSLSTTFFSFRKILFSEPFVSPSSRRSLCACQTLARRSLSATARREKRLWTLSRQRSRSFFSKCDKKRSSPVERGLLLFCFRKLRDQLMLA